MKLGLLVEAEEGLTWEHWRAIVERGEDLGFDSLWISDHLQSAWTPRHGLDAWVALAVAAASSERIGVGSLVSPITFRSPAVVARMAEAIDDLVPGRLTVGLGLGWNEAEHQAFGISFPGVAERVAQLGQGIERIRSMLGPRRLPILIGGGGVRSTLPLVARYADAWNMTTASPMLFDERNQALGALCEAIGRDPRRIRRSVAAGVLIGRDSADLRARARRLQAVVAPLAAVDLDEVPAAAREMGWLVGTPLEIGANLRALADVGVDLAILGLYDHTDLAALELMAETFFG